MTVAGAGITAMAAHTSAGSIVAGIIAISLMSMPPVLGEESVHGLRSCAAGLSCSKGLTPTEARNALTADADLIFTVEDTDSEAQDPADTALRRCAAGMGCPKGVDQDAAVAELAQGSDLVFSEEEGRGDATRLEFSEQDGLEALEPGRPDLVFEEGEGALEVGEPGEYPIGVAAAVVAAVPRRRLPDVPTTHELMADRLPGLNGGDPAPAIPAPQAYLDIAVAPERAPETLMLRASDRETDLRGTTEIGMELQARFIHDDFWPRFYLRIAGSSSQSRFERRGAARISSPPRGEANFTAYIPVDQGGPPVSVTVGALIGVKGRDATVTIAPYTEDGLAQLALVNAVKIIRSRDVPETPFAWDALVPEMTGIERPEIGNSNKVEKFVFPRTSKRRGLVVTVSATAEPIVQSTIDKVVNTPISLGKVTEISEETDLSLTVRIALFDIQARRPGR